MPFGSKPLCSITLKKMYIIISYICLVSMFYIYLLCSTKSNYIPIIIHIKQQQYTILLLIPCFVSVENSKFKNEFETKYILCNLKFVIQVAGKNI